MNIFTIIAGILIPPLGAGLMVGISTHFWINLILTFFGYVPGIVHFLWMVFTDKHLNP